jgi:hypothetical protein
VLDEEADLVGVGGDHDAHVVAALLGTDHAAEGVGADLVGEAAELFARDLPLLLLPARHAGVSINRFNSPSFRAMSDHPFRYVTNMMRSLRRGLGYLIVQFTQDHTMAPKRAKGAQRYLTSF